VKIRLAISLSFERRRDEPEQHEHRDLDSLASERPQPSYIGFQREDELPEERAHG